MKSLSCYLTMRVLLRSLGDPSSVTFLDFWDATHSMTDCVVLAGMTLLLVYVLTRSINKSSSNLPFAVQWNS